VIAIQHKTIELDKPGWISALMVWTPMHKKKKNMLRFTNI